MTSIAFLNVASSKPGCHISSNQGIGEWSAISCSISSSSMTNCSIGKLSSRRNAWISAPRPCIQGPGMVSARLLHLSPLRNPRDAEVEGLSPVARNWWLRSWHLWVWSVGSDSRLILGQRWETLVCRVCFWSGWFAERRRMQKDDIHVLLCCDRICESYSDRETSIRREYLYTLSLLCGTT